jgi:phospholipid/cholesterol/gamma-HCH transport system substrate-binding protein
MRVRIGVFVLLALVLLGVLVTLFSSAPSMFRRHNRYRVILSEAPGVGSGTPVRRSGVRIGEVEAVELDDETGVVRVNVLLDRRFTVRHNEQPVLTRGLLGDASIDFEPAPSDGKQPPDRSPVEPGSELQGVVRADARELIARAAEAVPQAETSLAAFSNLAQRLNKMDPSMEVTAREYRDLARELRQTLPEVRQTMKEFDAAARSWNKVGERLDEGLKTNQDKMGKTLDNINEAFTRLGRSFNDDNQKNLSSALKNMASASERINTMLSEENQRNFTATIKNMRAATDSMPGLMQNVDQFFKASQQSLQRIDATIIEAGKVINNLQRITGPLGDGGSDRLLKNVEEVSDRLIRVLTEMEGLLTTINHGEGTMQRLLSDPSLYDNLAEAACFVTRMLPRFDRIMRDMEIFADKLARHPESLGLGGLVRPSSGLKEAPRLPVYPRPPAP